VRNDAGVTAPLQVRAPQEMGEGGRPWNQPAGERWMKLSVYRGRPLAARLSGLPLEYCVLHVYGDEPGRWSGVLQFDVGQGTQDLGFRSDLVVNFDVTPVAPVQLSILDTDGKAATAALEFRDPEGRAAPSSFAPVDPLGWLVFVDLPVDEAYQPLYASMLRTGGLVLAGVLLAALAGLMLARRMTGPIHRLREGAARIGGGELSERIEIDSGDELEALAGDFNRMAARLQESYAGLEQKVEEEKERKEKLTD